MKRPRLSNLARVEIGKLKSQGIDPSPEEILWLNKLGNIAEHGAADSRLLLYSCKRMGNIDVYPLTLGAKLWLSTIAEEWFAGDLSMLTLAVVYALAHAREPEKLHFKNARKAKKEITIWAYKANLTEDEICSLMEQLPGWKGNGFDPLQELKSLIVQFRKHPRAIDLTGPLQCIRDAETEQTEGAFAPALSILMRHYGNTREHWLWEESDAFITDMMNKALQKEAQDRKEDDKVDVNDPALIAFRRLRNATRQIMAEHNGK